MVWSVFLFKLVGPVTMMKLLLFGAWLAGSMSDGSPLLDPVHSMVKRGSENIRVCGRSLVDALNLLCEGEYYDPSEDSSRRMGKRNVNAVPPQLDPYNDWIALSLSQGASNSDDISLQSPANQQKFNQLQRYQRGVVDECCRKPCSIATMFTYCRIAK